MIRTINLRLAAAISIGLWLAGCDPKQPATTDTSGGTSPPLVVENPNGPGWIHRDPQHPNNVAVVFVHGIFGDTKGTWTHENGSTFFDFVHNLPDIGPKLDIYAFGFSSHMLADGSLKIGEAAKKLDDFLDVDGVLKYDVVVFVAHSMGGLVTMRELITNDKLRAKVPLLVFYATPHEGSQITTIGRHLLNNPALQQMLPVDANDYLQQINDDWRQVADATPHPAVICAYEKKPVRGILVVPWSSSTRNCTESASAIEDSDHISIVKPDNGRHPSVIVLTKALNRYVAPALDTASVDTPKFQKNGEPWVFVIENAGNGNAAVFESRASVPLSYTLESMDSRQLVVYPPGMPRHVGSGGRDTVDLLLMSPLRQEYKLKLRIGATPERIVVARIPDMTAALAQRNSLESATAEGVNAYLADNTNREQFRLLSPDQQQQKLSALAEQSIKVRLPNTAPEVRLLLTADTLNGMNLSSSAAATLATLESRFPETARVEGVRYLAGVVSARTGKTDVLKTVPVPAVPVADATPAPERSMRTDAQLRSLTQLAENLQVTPATRAEATVLRGDVLTASGNSQAAAQVYREAAGAPAAPPAARERLRRGATAAGANINNVAPNR